MKLKNINVTINERRAPTDDSIRIAKEYEEKITERLAAGILRDIPGINAKFLDVGHDIKNYKNLIAICINDKTHIIEFDLRHQDPIKKTFDVIVNKITTTLLMDIYDAMINKGIII